MSNFRIDEWMLFYAKTMSILIDECCLCKTNVTLKNERRSE